MKTLLKSFPRRTEDESDTESVGWLKLTSATLLLGAAVAYAIFSDDAAPAAQGAPVMLVSFQPAADAVDWRTVAAEWQVADTVTERSARTLDMQPIDWHDQYEGMGDWPH